MAETNPGQYSGKIFNTPQRFTIPQSFLSSSRADRFIETDGKPDTQVSSPSKSPTSKELDNFWVKMVQQDFQAPLRSRSNTPTQSAGRRLASCIQFQGINISDKKGSQIAREKTSTK